MCYIALIKDQFEMKRRFYNGELQFFGLVVNNWLIFAGTIDSKIAAFFWGSYEQAKSRRVETGISSVAGW